METEGEDLSRNFVLDVLEDTWKGIDSFVAVVVAVFTAGAIYLKG